MSEKLPLHRIFLEVAQPDENGFSRWVSRDELIAIDPRFDTKNGVSWFRNDGPMGKKYHLKREHEGGRAVRFKLDGYNNTPQAEKKIAEWIKKAIKKQKCVVLQVGNNIECDHKNGKYDSRDLESTETQKLEDFQPMSKAANDAKRQHCKNCRETGKRFNARSLGYKEGYITGDEDTLTCYGCYWHDPHKFNQVISKDFDKQK